MQDEVKVSQADRDAAADYQDHARGYVCSAPLRDGRADHASIVQAFARHRQQAERAFEERERKLREAVQNIERICRENVRETDAPDRVKWDGVWHEGPLATAYIQTLQAFGELARQALKETPDAG